MKKLMAVITVVVLASIPVFAKAKNPDATTYPLTGTVAYSSFHSDSSASMTVNGQTYNAYCSTEGTNISCTDTAGVFEVTLADGTLVLVSHHLGSNPVVDSMHGTGTGTFNYRLETHSKQQYFCVPDNSRWKKACYEIDKEYDANMKALQADSVARDKEYREWCAAPLTDEEKQKGMTEKPEWCKKFTQPTQPH